MKDKYIDLFVRVFNLDKENVDENVVMGKTEGWDSVGHVAFITELEDTFDVMLDTEDIIAFNSYGKGIEILRKYGVEI